MICNTAPKHFIWPRNVSFMRTANLLLITDYLPRHLYNNNSILVALCMCKFFLTHFYLSGVMLGFMAGHLWFKTFYTQIWRLCLFNNLKKMYLWLNHPYELFCSTEGIMLLKLYIKILLMKSLYTLCSGSILILMFLLVYQFYCWNYICISKKVDSF